MIWEAFLHWLHLMAAVAWMGGMVFTAFVMAPILRKQMAPSLRLPLIRDAGVRFKYMEWACLGILFSTGFYKLYERGPWDQVFEGDFGRILLVKLILAAGMLVLSFLHSFVWGPGLSLAAPGSPEYSRLLWRLSFWARVNLALGLAVIFCAALLRMNPF